MNKLREEKSGIVRYEKCDVYLYGDKVSSQMVYDQGMERRASKLRTSFFLSLASIRLSTPLRQLLNQE